MSEAAPMRRAAEPRVITGLERLGREPGLLGAALRGELPGASEGAAPPQAAPDSPVRARAAETRAAPWRAAPWRAGLVANPAALTSDFRRAADLVAEAARDSGGVLVRLFGPEHGFYGEAQAGVLVPDSVDRGTGLAVHSLYTESKRPKPELLEDLDLLVLDLPDVGLRYFTYRSTLARLAEALADLCAAGRPRPLLLVLDRPNPLGGAAVEGIRLRPGFESFVGARRTPTRCGLTLGEFARLLAAERPFPLAVLPVGGEAGGAGRCPVGGAGWRRGALFPEAGLPWIMPSPNLPTFESLLAYAASGILEGTNASEGRGTTRPFEIFGAPGVDPEDLAGRLESRALPGLRFRPLFFRPTFSKHAGELCGGVQMHLHEPSAVRSDRTAFAILSAMRDLAPGFALLPPSAPGRKPFVDLILGCDLVSRGASEEELLAAAEADAAAFREERRPWLLYPEASA